MDVVLCKTGYGTVMEALLNSKSVLYTDRPGFREHPHMVKVYIYLSLRFFFLSHAHHDLSGFVGECELRRSHR